MPAGILEYGVLYYFEEGPSREQIYDAGRLGQSYPIGIQFVLRGQGRDWIGTAKASVEGVHQKGPDRTRLFIFGRLCTSHDYQNNPHTDIWHKAFFLAQCRLTCRSHGRILLAERSFFDNPLKQFGTFEESIAEL
jgi:hypothetical protein